MCFPVWLSPCTPRSPMTPPPRKLTALEICGWLVVLLWGLGAARELIVPVLIAALLAFMVAPLSSWLTRWKVPPGIAVAIAGLVLLLPFIALGFAMFTEG